MKDPTTLTIETGLAQQFHKKGGPVAKEHVGIDLHRRRSVIDRMDEAGDKAAPDLCFGNCHPVRRIQERVPGGIPR